jgi:hypothetical protein
VVNLIISCDCLDKPLTNLHANPSGRSVSQTNIGAHYTQISRFFPSGGRVNPGADIIAERARPAEFPAKSGGVGLAAAFLVVWWKPALLGALAFPGRRGARPPGLPAGARASAEVCKAFADAVARAAPAVVNIYTARVVTERTQAAPLDQLFGDYWPSYRQRIERSLGSGVIVDAKGPSSPTSTS